MRKFSILFISISLTIILSSTYYAQEWSAEQKEVWQVVEAVNETGTKGDVQGWLSYFDESFSGWDYESDAPIDKSWLKKFADYWFPNSKFFYYDITPAKIWVSGDYAFVHHYFSSYCEREGKKEREKEHWTTILMKKDGKWVVVGDHGGSSK